MRSVWIINHYAQVPDGPGGSRHYSLASRLAGYGWQSSVLAASVELNSNRQRLSPGQKQQTLIEADGLRFRWIATPSYEGNGAGRILNMLAFAWRVLLPQYRRDLPRPDVIIGSTVHPFAALSAAFLARFYRVPFVFEVRDLWPLTLVALGRLRAGGIQDRLLGLLERWLCRRASRIISVLPRFDEYARQYGIDSNRIVWIPNGADLDLFAEVPSPSRTDTFTLMYLGAHGNANSLDTLLEAMALLASRPECANIRCRLVGNGPLKASLIREAERRGLHNVQFTNPVPKSELAQVAAGADAFVLCARDLPELYRYGISMNKLYDYMAMGRPTVVALVAGNNPIAESGGGITVPPEDPAALADSIAQLADLPEAELQAMGHRAREYVEKYHDFRKLAGRLAATLDEVIAN